jgi:hypothetical protein
METSSLSTTSFDNQFFGPVLGHAKRSLALTAILAGMVNHAGGRISDVFKSNALRERAYRFVESKLFDYGQLLLAMALKTTHELPSDRFTFIPVDGSSLHLTDTRRQKGFGAIGTNIKGAQGIKVINAMAVNEAGCVLGMCWQEYWAREPVQIPAGMTKARFIQRRTLDKKETRYWHRAIQMVLELAEQARSKLWFVVDREGDSRTILELLANSGARFTVRGGINRRLISEDKEQAYLYHALAKRKAKGSYTIAVPATDTHAMRVAQMRFKSASVVLRLRDQLTEKIKPQAINVVLAYEHETPLKGIKPLHWLLFTNAPVATNRDILEVIRSYKMRWKIEEFHKTWKSGHCCVEEMQLRSFGAACKMAIMQTAIAVRIEQLKTAVKENPDALANDILTLDERRAIVVKIKLWNNLPLASGGRRQKIWELPNPEKMTVMEAILWTGRFGGWVEKKGTIAGSIILGRGLHEIMQFTSHMIGLEMLKLTDQW